MNGWHHDHCLRCQKPSPRLPGSTDEKTAHCCWCWQCHATVIGELEARRASPFGRRPPVLLAVVRASERQPRSNNRARLVTFREAESLYVYAESKEFSWGRAGG